jgi:hypothetical protein
LVVGKQFHFGTLMPFRKAGVHTIIPECFCRESP